ncbi:MAG: TIGR02588 family protein [Cyanobacteria bacterium P01_D01_bin.105]
MGAEREKTESKTASKTAEPTAHSKRRSPAEWITLTLSALLLSVLVGLVLYDWQLSKNLPPAFQVEVSETTRLTQGRYYVPFTLRNTGGRIARTVQVIAELSLPDGDTENGEQQFDFLSGSERKKGSFVFDHNPQDGTLVVRVASFGLP